MSWLWWPSQIYSGHTEMIPLEQECGINLIFTLDRIQEAEKPWHQSDF